jgi:hypothetical protein
LSRPGQGRRDPSPFRTQHDSQRAAQRDEQDYEEVDGDEMKHGDPRFRFVRCLFH